jgi:AcrR family transcriptional regulator
MTIGNDSGVEGERRVVHRQATDGGHPDMRQSLVEAGLTLIDEAEGCRGVTLRAIANRAGCAHTNVYNYFPSLESVFWECLLEAQRRNMEFLGRQVARAAPGSLEVVGALVGAHLDFALAHPGWYRLIWLEPVDQHVPPELLPRLKQPRGTIATMLRPLFGPEVSEADLRRIADLLHTYVHGAICKLIARRTLADQEPADPQRMVENTLLLLRLLGSDLTPRDPDTKGEK